MHHPRSICDVVRFRLAATLLLGNCLLGATVACMLVYSLMFDDRRLALIGSGLLILVLFLIVAQWIAGLKSACPLCQTPVLSPKSCVKHRRARTFLGSHRLRVAAAIVFKSQFRCPYCNEPTAMTARETVHGTRTLHPESDGFRKRI